jgi:hypothetical protein
LMVAVDFRAASVTLYERVDLTALLPVDPSLLLEGAVPTKLRKYCWARAREMLEARLVVLIE